MPKQGRGIPVFLISVAAVPVLSLLSFVPFRFLTIAGSWLGALYFRIDTRRKKIGLENLSLAFGKNRSDAELKKTLESVYKQFGSSLLEFAASPRLNRTKIDKLVRLHGLEKLEAEKKAGKGVFLLIAHLGNWELCGQAMAMNGIPVNIIGRKANVGLLHNYIVRCRERHGNRVILRDKAMRKILRLLKQGEILAAMIDQRGSTGRGLLIDFFGKPAPTNKDLARIILKTGTSVMTVFNVRNPDQTHSVYFSDPLKFELSHDHEKDVRRIVEQYTKALEDFIEKHPDQWIWMHRRWMRRGTEGGSSYQEAG
jgi:KDO2-lipid IV(A) lauroyltransferase